MNRFKLSLLLCLTLSCGKPKEARAEGQPEENTADRRAEIYADYIRFGVDQYGLLRMGDSIGDSALFSCLARAAGVIKFDIGQLFRDGKPIRHPEIYEDRVAPAPVSKDMMSGLLWCLVTDEDRDEARALIEAWIAYGSRHEQAVGWIMCDVKDEEVFHITAVDFAGMCIATPSLVHDIYEAAIYLGSKCDARCQYWRLFGFYVPPQTVTGFERHLAVLSITRAGYMHGAISEAQLAVLEVAAKQNPRNPVYGGAVRPYDGGAGEVVDDVDVYPLEHAPTAENTCSEYPGQRDEDLAPGIPNPDWSSCEDKPTKFGRGLDWLFGRWLSMVR